MDMNRAFYLHNENRQPRWILVDAAGKTLGRLATEIADMLRGKHVAWYTPHADAGDYVVVINAEKVKLTGNKLNGKKYASYSGWIGGYKEISARDMLAKKPTFLIEHAVKGMMPKNILSDAMIKKLKVYAGDKHPHTAHKIEPLVK